MASFLRENDKDELVSCPNNPCHRMKKSRLQFHLNKCKDGQNIEKKACPFNATHRIPAPEYHHHLETCPNRDIVDRKIIKFSDETVEKDEPTILPVASYNDIVIASESWDQDIDPLPKPGYDPKYSQKKVIFQDLSKMTPAERRQYYQNLHSINDKEESDEEEEIEYQLKELRQPKDKPEVLQFQSPVPANLGLGRGVSTTGHRRIAANIFGLQNNSVENSLYDVAIGRGGGRGTNI